MPPGLCPVATGRFAANYAATGSFAATAIDATGFAATGSFAASFAARAAGGKDNLAAFEWNHFDSGTI